MAPLYLPPEAGFNSDSRIVRTSAYGRPGAPGTAITTPLQRSCRKQQRSSPSARSAPWTTG